MTETPNVVVCTLLGGVFKSNLSLEEITGSFGLSKCTSGK